MRLQYQNQYSAITKPRREVSTLTFRVVVGPDTDEFSEGSVWDIVEKQVDLPVLEATLDIRFCVQFWAVPTLPLVDPNYDKFTV